MDKVLPVVQRLVKRHGIAGPLLCGGLILGSLYGTVIAVRQIKTEWAIIKKNSRQKWKNQVIVPDQ